MTDRQDFLRMRSVQISAFEATTEEEDARLWAEALRNADLIFGEPEYRCTVCGSEDRAEHNDEMHAQEGLW